MKIVPKLERLTHFNIYVAVYAAEIVERLRSWQYESKVFISRTLSN